MADSIRKRIVDAVMAMLDGSGQPGIPTVASGRVNKSRRLPVGRHEMPMYSVYFINEAPTAAGNPRRPVILDRKLLIEVRIIVEGDDDAADKHVQWVTAKLGAAERIIAGDGTQLTLGVTETETLFEPLEGSEAKVTITSIRWMVEYRTNPADITRLS